MRGHAGDYDLVMVIDEQGDGWHFTVRERGGEGLRAVAVGSGEEVLATACTLG